MIKVFKNKKVINIVLIIFFCIVSFLSCALLIHTSYLFNSLDMQFHLKRILVLRESLKHGNILPTISFSLFHGSTAMMFYPYINLLPVAFLSIFIKSDVLVVYTFFMIDIFITLVVSYYSSLQFSKSKVTSLIFSLIYGLSEPLFAYSFFNMDMGVMTSIAVLPLIFFGCLNLLKYNKYIELSIGIILIAYSHVLTLFIIIPFLMLFLIINRKKITKYTILNLCKLFILVILLTSIVWMPVVKLIFMNIGNIEPPHPNQLFGTSFKLLTKNIILNRFSVTLNIFAFITLIIPVLFYKMFYKRFSRYIKQSYWLSVVIVLICSNLFPWNITNHSVFKIFRIFQFTRRFYIIPELLLSYIFSYCVTKLIKNKCFKWIVIIITVILAGSLQFMSQRSLIKNNISAPIATKYNINKNVYTTKTQVHHKILPLKQFHGNSKGLFFKMHNNQQLLRYIDITTDNVDYYPIKSLYNINFINNNYGRLKNNKIIPIKYYGYNHFMFKMKRNSRLVLPIVTYRGERIHLYDNNKPIDHYINRDDLIVLKTTNKGLNRLSINNSPDVFIDIIKICLFAFGIIWLMYRFIKWLKINYFNVLRN